MNSLLGMLLMLQGDLLFRVAHDQFGDGFVTLRSTPQMD